MMTNKANKIARKNFERDLRERIAMAMCACETLNFHPLLRSSDGALHLPDDHGFISHSHVCVCARDGRRPVTTTLKCAEMLIKADAALAVMGRENEVQR